MGVPSSAHTSYFDAIVKTRWRSRKTSRSNARSTPAVGARGVLGGGPALRWRRHDGHSSRRPAYSGRSSYTSPHGHATTTPALARLTAWTGAASWPWIIRPARPRQRPRGLHAAVAGGGSVVRRRQLQEQRGHAVPHLRERHRIDDLLADAVVVLAAEVRLAPEVVELHGAHGLADLLRVEALGFPDRGHEGERRIREVDARRVPLTEPLRVALLPALELVRQRGLHVAVHPHALGVLAAGDARHHRAVDLVERDEAPLEAELARLLDDQADAARRRGHHADRVRFLGEHAQQDRIEVRHAALEELLGDDVVAELLHVRRLDLHRPPAGVVVRRDRGHALELRLLLLDPLPERRRLGRCREALEGERVLRAHETLGVGQGQPESAGLVDGFLVRLRGRAAEDGDVLHAILGDQPVDGGHPLGDHVFVIVGDDLELVLLAPDVEPALSI